MAVYSNLYIDQGSHFYSVIIVEDILGNIFDLTQFSARGQVRKSYSSSDSVEFSTSIINPTEGEINISLSSVQTRNMKAGRYVYDIELYTINPEDTIRVVEGQLIVNPDQSRLEDHSRLLKFKSLN